MKKEFQNLQNASPQPSSSAHAPQPSLFSSPEIPWGQGWGWWRWGLGGPPRFQEEAESRDQPWREHTRLWAGRDGVAQSTGESWSQSHGQAAGASTLSVRGSKARWSVQTDNCPDGRILGLLSLC